MPPRLFRSLLCLIAVAVLCACFGDDALRLAARDVAVGSSAGLFVLWRWALVSRRRAEQGADPVPAPLSLDPQTLVEAEHRVVAAVAEAASFEAGLLVSAALLRAELGPRAASAYRVESRGPSTFVAEMFGLSPGLRAPLQALASNGSVLARAIEARRLCLDLPAAAALPVVDLDGDVAAAIELRGLDLPVDAVALVGLLQRVGTALVAARHRTGSEAGDGPPVTGSSTRDRRASARSTETVDAGGEGRFQTC